MNCEKCSELLIDYLEDTLSAEEAGTVKEHLDSCPKCSLELEELSVIRGAAHEAAVPEPSPEVLLSLSKAARENAAPKRSPFWKQWSYSPIIVPTLSVAIALSVWFYYGYQDMSGIDTVSRNVGALKMSPQKRQSESFSHTEEKDKAPAMEAGEDSEALMGMTEAQEQKRAPHEEARTSLPAAPPDISGDTVSDDAPGSGVLRKKEITEEDLVTYRKEKSPSSELLERESRQAVSHKSPNETASEDLLKARQPLLKDYATELELALRQQSSGDCEASIKTNEALLNSSPPPPAAVQAGSYKSLAECYVETGELGKAVSSYKNLSRVEPGESEYVNKKLEGIKMDAAYMNYEGSEPGTEPAD